MTSHLEEFLGYYIKLKAPRYAVLITGAWGTGKTHQVLEFLEDEEHCYVSLYGLQSADDIHSSVLAAMNPSKAKAHGFLENLSNMAKDAGGVASVTRLVPDVVKMALRHEVDSDCLLVFDDFERSGLALDDKMGVINFYLEQHGCRVVVVAHDEELIGDFILKQEKLIGQTIRVEPDVADAFKGFSSSLPTPAQKSFVNDHEKVISSIFDNSSTKSLRILRHLIQDLGRLRVALSDTHLQHPEALMELVMMFSAMDIEVRSGGLFKDDLRNRVNLSLVSAIQKNADKEGNAEKPRLLIADDKYPTIDLESNLLQDDVLVRMLCEGRYDRVKIQESLNNSHYFLIPESVQPWKIVINFDELNDTEVESAATRMNQQFENREVTDIGEMQHIFSLRLMMAENRILLKDICAVADSCIDYISDLLAEEKLQPAEASFDSYEHIYRAYDGYTYWVSDATKESFQRVQEHLIKSREEALKKQLPSLSKQLLELVSTDGQQFFNQICSTSEGEGPYVRVPILASIPADEFMKAWLGAPPANWRSIRTALNSRYGSLYVNSDLLPEREWAIQLLSLLRAEADNADGFKALRIERLIPPNLRLLAEK